MSFERKQRSMPCKAMPKHCGACPDSRCSVCSRLLVIAPELAREFAGMARRITYEPGEDLNTGRGFHRSISVVVSGVAMLSRVLEDGRCQIAAFRYPGEPIALGGMIPTGGTVSAATPLEICRIDEDHLDGFVASYPQSGKSMIDLASKQMSEMLDHIVLLGRLDASERVAAFVVDCANRCGDPDPDGISLALPMNRNQIADYLGINTETVSRQFSRLKELGLVTLLSPSRLLIPELGNLRNTVPTLASGFGC